MFFFFFFFENSWTMFNQIDLELHNFLQNILKQQLPCKWLIGDTKHVDIETK